MSTDVARREALVLSGRLSGMVQGGRCRATGAVIAVFHADALGLDDSTYPWAVVCETHAKVIRVGNRKLACTKARWPDWCPDCFPILTAREATHANAAPRPKAVAPLGWQYDDGGRRTAGRQGYAKDCTIRAVAIATGLDYRFVFDELSRREHAAHRRLNGDEVADHGIHLDVTTTFLAERGWQYVIPVSVHGRRAYLRAGDLPPVGTFIVHIRRHLVAVVDGIARDTGHPSRSGKHQVLGYWRRA